MQCSMTVAGSSQVGACLAYADTWWGGRGHVTEHEQEVCISVM